MGSQQGHGETGPRGHIAVVSGSVPIQPSLAAETLGTALLVATVVGSGIMANRSAGGNVTLALLDNTILVGGCLSMLAATLFSTCRWSSSPRPLG